MSASELPPTPAQSAEAVVARVDFGSCALLGDDESVIEATVAANVMGRTKSLGNTVVVGDRVAFEVGEGTRPRVTEVRPRANAFSRRAAGERSVEQVVAANVDQVVLVASIVEPEFSAGFADRVLCQADHAGIPARLVLNKVDLAQRGHALALLGDYPRAGYFAQLVSAKTGEGMDALHRACVGKRSLFVGHSGVGKSTLLNTLVPGLDLLSGRVNAKTGKGRHTTTAAWLVRPEPGFELIDTPGVRAFGLWGIGPRDLEHAYPEFRPLLGACKFRDCRHDQEPGCALVAGVQSGAIAERRLQSFLKLRAELEEERMRG